MKGVSAKNKNVEFASSNYKHELQHLSTVEGIKERKLKYRKTFILRMVNVTDI